MHSGRLVNALSVFDASKRACKLILKPPDKFIGFSGSEKTSRVFKLERFHYLSLNFNPYLETTNDKQSTQLMHSELFSQFFKACFLGRGSVGAQKRPPDANPAGSCIPDACHCLQKPEVKGQILENREVIFWKTRHIRLET